MVGLTLATTSSLAVTATSTRVVAGRGLALTPLATTATAWVSASSAASLVSFLLKTKPIYFLLVVKLYLKIIREARIMIYDFLLNSLRSQQRHDQPRAPADPVRYG